MIITSPAHGTGPLLSAAAGHHSPAVHDWLADSPLGDDDDEQPGELISEGCAAQPG